MKLFIMLSLSFIAQMMLITSTNAASLPDKAETIVVTLPPLSGLSTMLLPEVKNQCLLSAGADPHHFQPSPKQVDLINQGQLLIRASRDDQGWPIQTQAEHTLDLSPTEKHAWLQFSQVRHMLPILAQTLVKNFPQYQQRIQTRLKHKLQTINQLESAWDKQLQVLNTHGVFMQHPAWQGLFDHKKVPIWAVLESEQHGHEQGPRHLEKALYTLKEHPSAVLIGSTRHSNRSLEWLSRHHSPPTHIILLDELGRCNQAWDELMQHNLDILAGQL
ncbi:MAG: zinc ABC transporter substrate-binding protein [Ghiorsea sp.]|nr:zinc ABC transporter substrate-binding protein [Ghiorsea sp.]